MGPEEGSARARWNAELTAGTPSMGRGKEREKSWGGQGGLLVLPRQRALAES